MIDLEFSDSEVKSVARELGLPGSAFDDPARSNIIKNWKNADIVACPGSGKTTVLLAKLLLLSRRMPFEDGKGICVLTHTNVAIDEIKAKLGQKSDILFKHPNFFGTIQSFVDKFLTIPCCAKTHNIRPRVENTLYFQLAESRYNHKTFPKGYFEPREGFKYFKYLRYNFDDISIISHGLFGGAFCDIKRSTYIETKKIKKNITKMGVISFEDAFSIANWYLKNNIKLKSYISSRYKFLFIDEMQDTQKHQSEIINKIFDERVIKQFYGDPDQAIFNGIGGGESVWEIDKSRKLEITDSKRFGKSISSCIYPFRREISNVEGRAKESIQPYIILYEKEEDALVKFATLITKIHRLYELPEYKSWNWNKTSDPFNAIGFVGKDNQDKVTIQNYFRDFSKETISRKFYFSNLISYFQRRPADEIQKQGTRIYYLLFLNALNELLDKSGCKNPDNNRNFTKTSLLKYLREKNEDQLIGFQETMAKWIKCLHYDKKRPDHIKTEFIEFFKLHLKDKFPEFKNFILNSDFVKADEECIEQIDIIKKQGNFFKIDGTDIKIKIGTVHSVKGETHLATLFLETQNDGKFETDYFFNDECGNLFCNEEYRQPKSFTLLERRMKTTYVAMSRPSHLLCVALNKNRAKCPHCSDEEKENCNWNIQYI